MPIRYESGRAYTPSRRRPKPRTRPSRRKRAEPDVFDEILRGASIVARGLVSRPSTRAGAPRSPVAGPPTPKPLRRRARRITRSRSRVQRTLSGVSVPSEIRELGQRAAAERAMSFRPEPSVLERLLAEGLVGLVDRDVSAAGRRAVAAGAG